MRQLLLELFLFVTFASPALSRGNEVAEIPHVVSASEIVRSKTLLGKFPRSEDPAVRAAKLVPSSQWNHVHRGAWPEELKADDKFTLSFQKINDDTGDFERFRAVVRMKNGKEIILSKHPVSFAVISPNSKYVAVEPLTLIDVDSRKSFDVSKETGIPNYISIHYWSKDGKSLLISQSDCGMDCPKEDKFSYWRIDLK